MPLWGADSISQHGEAEKTTGGRDSPYLHTLQFSHFMNQLLGCWELNFCHTLPIPYIIEHVYKSYQCLLPFSLLCKIALQLKTVCFHLFSGMTLPRLTFLPTFLTPILPQALTVHHRTLEATLHSGCLVSASHLK
jgi:hypothetical protein